ncbi:MAG: hypothetical protein AAGI46_02650 [Planctomycetota bacterium]
MKRRHIQSVLAAAVVAAMPAVTHADDLTWQGNAGPLNFWDTATNWTPAQTPDSTDNVFLGRDIGLGLETIILGATSNAANVNFTSGQWELTGAAGGVLTSTGFPLIDDLLATDLDSGVFVNLSNGAVWNSQQNFSVAGDGFGTLLVDSGSVINARAFRVGGLEDQDGVGVMTVSGTGSRLEATLNLNTNLFAIGFGTGTGTLNVLDGATMGTTTTGAGDIRVGDGVGSTGTLNVDGVGSFVETEDLLIGNTGDGFLNVTNGGRVILTDGTSPQAIIGVADGANGAAFVSGAGSELTGWRVEVGSSGNGRLVVSDGGLARARFSSSDIATGNGDVQIGFLASAQGVASVVGTGTLQADRFLLVGNDGDGTLLVGRDLANNSVGGGTVIARDLYIGEGVGNTFTNAMIVDGGTVNVGNNIRVGSQSAGTMEVLNGSTVTATDIQVGALPGANGTLTVDGVGTSVTATEMFAGNRNSGDPSVGVINVQNNATATFTQASGVAVTLGDDPGGEGTINISSGGSVATTGVAEVWVGGSSNDTGGVGTINVASGGSFTSGGRVIVGWGVDAVGAIDVTGNGSTFDGNGDFVLVGFGGTGTLGVSDGASFTANGVFLGDGSLADGTMTVSGNTTTADIDGTFIVGDTGLGSLTIDGGATVTSSGGSGFFIVADEGNSDGSSLTISGAGSTLDYAGTNRVILGHFGGSSASPTTVLVEDGGLLRSSGAVNVSEQDNSNTLLTVDGGTIEGTSMNVAVDPGTVADVVVSNGGRILIDDFAEIAAENNGNASLIVEDAGSLFQTGGDFSVSATASVNSDGDLFVRDGGRVETGNLGFVGRFNNDRGTATIGGTGAPASWTIGSTLFVGPNTASGFGLLNVEENGTVDVEGPLSLRQNGTVSVNGGSLEFDSLTLSGGTLNFNSGAVRFTNATGTTLSPTTIEAVLGEDATIVDGQTFGVEGLAVLGGGFRINGGRFEVGSIGTSGFDQIDFDRGTFALTNSNLIVGSNGLFGSTATLTQDQNLEVANDVIVQAGSELTLVGGYSAGRTINAGAVTFITPSGTKVVDGEFETTGDTTLVGNVQFEDLVSGPGNFFGPGQAIFAGGYAPGNSPGVVEFEGDVTFGEANDLEIELEGLSVGEFDRLEILGDLALGGTLTITDGDGFVPSIGDVFEIFTFNSISGAFSSVVNATSDSSLMFDLDVGLDSLVLRVLGDLFPGDANGDGTVDLADFGILRANFGSTNGTFATGDFNGDMNVDLADFGILRANFGSSSNASAFALMDAWAVTVPEPTLVAPALVGLLALRRRRSN